MFVVLIIVRVNKCWLCFIYQLFVITINSLLCILWNHRRERVISLSCIATWQPKNMWNPVTVVLNCLCFILFPSTLVKIVINNNKKGKANSIYNVCFNILHIIKYRMGKHKFCNYGKQEVLQKTSLPQLWQWPPIKMALKDWGVRCYRDRLLIAGNQEG